MRWTVLLLVTLVACGEAPPPPLPSECVQPAQVTGAVPAFCLYDTNSTSPTDDQAVSPRDYLETVSGWYFATAT